MAESPAGTFNRKVEFLNRLLEASWLVIQGANGHKKAVKLIQLVSLP